MSIVPQNNSACTETSYKSIDYYNNSLFLISESAVEKYQIFNTFISLEFSINQTGRMFDNILSRENTILLDKVPLLILNDPIYCY